MVWVHISLAIFNIFLTKTTRQLSCAETSNLSMLMKRIWPLDNEARVSTDGVFLGE